MAIITCDSCAPGIVNDDWTHLDMNEDADETYASITGTLEVLGLLTPEGEADMPGYFDCAVCNETQCGGGHRFLTQTEGA
jgi:hypothetical protein